MDSKKPTHFDGPGDKNWDQEKKRLECLMLEAEIGQTSLAWWKRPAYLGGATPVIVAILGFISAWLTGYFDQRKDVLEAEVATLNETKSRLDIEVAQAKSQRDQALTQARQAQRSIDEIYLKVSMETANARYALSHIKPPGAGDGNVSAERLDRLRQLAKDTENADLQGLAQEYRAALDMIDTSHNSADQIFRVLGNRALSPRAKRLKQQPPPNETSYIDPETGRTYTIETLNTFLDGDD